MNIVLSLITRKHHRDLTDSSRDKHDRPAHHPLSKVDVMKFRFRDPNYDEDNLRDIERIALVLEGDSLPNIGLASPDDENGDSVSSRLYPVLATLVVRESPEGYCRRISAAMVSAHIADALEDELRTMRYDMRTVIASFTAVCTGRRENEEPDMVNAWCQKERHRTDTEVFLFFHPNYMKHGGEAPRWVRLQQAAIIDGTIRTMDGYAANYEDILRLFPK